MKETPAVIVDRVCVAAGGIPELARKLGIKQPSIREWKMRSRIPAERVLELERLTGISRHDMRPDIYGPGDDRASA